MKQPSEDHVIEIGGMYSVGTHVGVKLAYFNATILGIGKLSVHVEEICAPSTLRTFSLKRKYQGTVPHHPPSPKNCCLIVVVYTLMQDFKCTASVILFNHYTSCRE